MFIARYLVYLLFLLWLGGCESISSMFEGENNAELPTPLTKINSSVTVSGVWSKNVGDTHYAVNLKPIYAGQRLYTASP